jgi:hypothetical protein
MLNSSSTTKISATLTLAATLGVARCGQGRISILPRRLRQYHFRAVRIRFDDDPIPGDLKSV